MKLSARFLPSLALLVSLVIFNIYIYQLQPNANPNLTNIYFLNVGQGDAAYIRTADQYNIVIDTGPSPKVSNLLNRLIPVWDRDIDLLILTHPHADHIGGASQIIDQFPIRNILLTEVDYESQLYSSLLENIIRHDIKTTYALAGSNFNIGESVVKIISPTPDILSDSDLNNTSIANLYSYHDFDIMFTGDISTKVEEAIIRNYQLPETEILKVGHHGSNTSSSEDFINYLQPKYAVISVGQNNRYNHPSESVVDRFINAGIELLRTDLNSNIHFSTDGSSFKLIN